MKRYVKMMFTQYRGHNMTMPEVLNEHHPREYNQLLDEFLCLPQVRHNIELLLIGPLPPERPVDPRIINQLDVEMKELERHPKLQGDFKTTFTIAQSPRQHQAYVAYRSKPGGQESGDVASLEQGNNGSHAMMIVDGVTPDKTSDELAKSKLGIRKPDRFTADAIIQILRKTITRTDFQPEKFNEILSEEVLVAGSDLIKKYNLTGEDLNNMLLRATAAAYFRPNHTVPGHLMLVGDVQAVGIKKDGTLQVYREGQSYLDSWTGTVKRFDSKFADTWIRKTYKRKPSYPGKYGTHSLILTDSPYLLAYHMGRESGKEILYPVDEDVICVIITSDGMPEAKLLPFYTLLPYMYAFQSGQSIIYNPVISQNVLVATEYMRAAEHRRRFIHAERGGPQTDDLSFGVMMLETRGKTPSTALIKAFLDCQDLHTQSLTEEPRVEFPFQTDQAHNVRYLYYIQDILREFISQKFPISDISPEERTRMIQDMMQYIYQYAYESKFSTPSLPEDSTS